MDTPMSWARIMDGIRPFYVMEVLEKAAALEAQGRDIVRLEVGEPDFPTPPAVLAAARRALDADETRYTSALGILPLREAIARWYERQYGVRLPARRVIVTPGTSGAFLLAFGILLDPGQRVAIADPGYPCYANMIQMQGGVPVRVPVGPEDHYQLSAERLRPLLAQGLRGALVTSPSNPTGTLIPPRAFQEVLALMAGGGGIVISDEIYHGITYGENARSALEFTDRVMVINGFSKYFAMTGWRLGWLIVPDDAVRRVEMLAQNLFISASTLAQHAALAAFSCEDFLDARIRENDEKRHFLLERLPPLGFHIAVEPKGAFYIYADASEALKRSGHEDSVALCNTLLQEAGVALTPGIDFGDYRSRVHVRFSYATSFARVREGVARLERFLR